MTATYVATAEDLVFADVKAEVDRQIELWGVQSHPNGTGSQDDVFIQHHLKLQNAAAVENDTLTWRGIAIEEAYEAFAEPGGQPLYEELIQSAAVMLSWARDLRAKGEVTDEDK